MTPSRRGFTLIEMLILFVIACILLLYAIPNYKMRRVQKVHTELQDEIRKVFAAQRRMVETQRRYATEVRELGVTPPADVKLEIGIINPAMPTGWHIIAKHEEDPPASCLVGFGVDTLVAGVPLKPGVIRCL